MSLLWQSFLDAIGRLKSPRLSDQLKTEIKREDQLMSYLLADHEFVKLISTWLDDTFNKNKDGKSLEKATIFRLVGNREFQSKKYTSSLNSYTKSAMYAPLNSEDRSVAIANRSASLFYLGKCQECIKDIELAIQFEYPHKLCYKLYLRAVQCYIKLGKREFATVAFHQAQELIKKYEDMPSAKKDSLDKQLIQLASAITHMVEIEDNTTTSTESRLAEVAFGENPNFPSASAGIEIKYAPQKGRYVVANRNIKRGQTLFVEKPFAFVRLNNDKSNEICEHCCGPCGDTPIPCSRCLNTFFCDINCWNKGCSFYHSWECPGNQVELWQQIGIAHLALKVLLISTTTSDNIKFNQVQQLVTNFNNLATNDLFVYGITAIMLTLYLSKYTDYFKTLKIKEHIMSKFSDNTFNFNNSLTTEDDERLYISSLILRHILQLISNGHAITKINMTPSHENKLCVEQQERIATAIYPSASMMNHSCDPNIINSFMNQYLIIKATKDITAGEEVFHCYGPYFRKMSKEERQEILKKQYSFICKCEPCVMPEYQNFMDRFTAIKCPECSGALQEFHNYSMHCLDCGAMPVINYQIELRRAAAAFDAAQIFVDLRKEEEALVKLKECLGIRKAVLYKYHQDVTITLDLLAKIYALMERWLDSISQLEHCVAAIEEQYGSTSTELANELNKLTDICIRYLQEEPNRTTKWYKNILKKTRRYLDRIEEIIDFTYGPWNKVHDDVAEKKKILFSILKDFDV